MNITSRITTLKVFSSETFSLGQIKLSDAIDLRDSTSNYYFSVFYMEVGAGSLKLEYLVGPTRTGPFVKIVPALESVIDAGTAGTKSISFLPIISPFIQIQAKELSLGTVTSFDLWLHVS